MSEYNCDNWVVIKMKGDDPHYRLLVGTSGGYLDGSSWRMNSGITEVNETDDDYYFKVLVVAHIVVIKSLTD